MLQKNKIIPKADSEKNRIEKYLRFIVFFNEFINHRRKPRRQFIEREMKL